MGYESKITVVASGHGYAERLQGRWAETIMTLNLSKMPYDFSNLFVRTVSDFGIYYYLEDGNTRVDSSWRDPYNEPAKACGLTEVLNWLKDNIATCKDNGEPIYRRTQMLYDSLKTFKKKDWKELDIYIVHTGY